MPPLCASSLLLSLAFACPPHSNCIHGTILPNTRWNVTAGGSVNRMQGTYRDCDKIILEEITVFVVPISVTMVVLFLFLHLSLLVFCCSYCCCCCLSLLRMATHMRVIIMMPHHRCIRIQWTLVGQAQNNNQTRINQKLYRAKNWHLSLWASHRFGLPPFPLISTRMSADIFAHIIGAPKSIIRSSGTPFISCWPKT